MPNDDKNLPGLPDADADGDDEFRLPGLPDDESDGGRGLPGLDLGALLETAQQMQQSLLAAQQEAAHQQVTGVSGGGAVRITVTGSMEFVAVEIDARAIDPDDAEMLQDLVLAALHDASARVAEINQNAMGQLGGLGGLGGLLGG